MSLIRKETSNSTEENLKKESFCYNERKEFKEKSVCHNEGIDLDDSDMMERIADAIPPPEDDASVRRLCGRSIGKRVATEDAFSAQTDIKFATEPRTFKQATHPRNPNRVEWQMASDKEMNSQLANKTWVLVRLPSGKFEGCSRLKLIGWAGLD